MNSQAGRPCGMVTERPKQSKEIVSNLLREQDKLAAQAAAVAFEGGLFPGANLLGQESHAGFEHVAALEKMLQRATEKQQRIRKTYEAAQRYKE